MEYCLILKNENPYMKYLLLPVLFVSTTTLLFSQSIEEIKKTFPAEQMLYKNESVHYEFKIINGEPYAESTKEQELLYVSDNAVYMSRFGFYQSGFNEVKSYTAYTISPEGKKILVKDFKTSENRSRSVFYDDIKETSFNYPSITNGSIGHLELTTVHKNLRLLSSHYFTHGVPVVNGELKLTFPKEMVIKYKVMGKQKDKVEISTESRKKETTYTFKVHNLEKDQSYPDAPDNAYYALHIIFYIDSYINEKGEVVKWLGTTEDLYKFYRGFINNINKETSPELERVTDSLTLGISGNEAKARNIYKWVQQHIKYVAFENGMEGFVPRDANLVCNRRFGDCKDMASILTKMLQYANVPAYFVWIGTRNLPYDYTDVPLPIVDNHMIAAIKLDTNFIFLDGTDSHGVFGIPSDHIQGKQALIAISDKEFKIVRVPVEEKENNIYTDTTILRLTDQGIHGTISIGTTGYYAMNFYRLMNQTDEKAKEKLMNNILARGSNKFKLDKYEIIETNNPGKYRINSQFELQGFDKKIADEWYLNLNLYKFYEHQEIDYPKRQLPVEFDFKNERRYVTILEIPEGYQVSYLPESKSFHNDTWGFDLIYETKKNQVILTQKFENNHLLLPVDKFQSWNKVLENLFPNYKETISLVKK